MILGVDVGGTFTDAALFDGSTLHTAKAPTTPGDQSVGVLRAVEKVLAQAGATAGRVTSFSHGMTVGTNALLERSGARTALLATEGFTDLLEVARQDRPSLYRLNAPKPDPLVDADLRFGVAERIGPDGVVTALAETELRRVADAVAAADPDAVAICLLFAFSHPEHEARLAAAIEERLPGRPVRASHQVLAQFREYERCSTTVIDAYLAPKLASYLRNLIEASARAGLPEPRIMQSSGGVIAAEEAVGSGAWSVLSGPAGGAVGAAAVANGAAGGNAIGLDMGGTSCDVCLVEGGSVRRTDSRQIDGRVIQLPMIDIETVGAGGGSIAWADSGGALRVGPRSAGADPGPACYGHGGTAATVTDANLVLGRLPAGQELPGGLRLDLEAAEAAVGRLAEQLDLDLLRTAEGIIRVADQEMARAVRRMTVERGVDPRRFALLPFGGAGPMHAAGIAEQVGIDRIVCPRAGGVLSAVGLCAADRRRDAARTLLWGERDLDAETLAETVASLAESLSAGEHDRLEVSSAMRYRGQAFELEVPTDPEPDPKCLCRDFTHLHEARYGFSDPNGEVELVTLRVAAVEPGPEVGLAAAAGDLSTSTRKVRFGGAWVETSIFRGDLRPGHQIEGPAIAEMPGATLVLPPEWQAEVDGDGTVIAELRQVAK